MTTRLWSRAAVCGGLVLGSLACGERADETPASDDDEALATAFCDEVSRRVETWLDSVRSAAPATGESRRGGTLVVGGLGDLRAGLNGFGSADYAARMHQQFVGLMPLVRYDEDIRPSPWLAESWEIAPDSTSVTFHLRDDVRWHDGEPTDAHDVAFTYRRVTDPDLGWPNDAFWRFWTRGDSGIEVIDDHTVRIRTRPHADMLDPWTVVPIMPEHLLGDVPVGELGNHPFGERCPVGNGPFVFREHRLRDRWTFESNPAFPSDLGGPPLVDRYVYRIIPEQTTLSSELRTGGIDVYVQVRPDQVAALQADPDIEIFRFDSRSMVFVVLNNRIPQFSDLRVRRALAMGWDRAGFVRSAFGEYGEVLNTTVTPAHWAHHAPIGDSLAYDPDEAGRLLDEAGFVDRDGDGVRESSGGVPLSFELGYPQNNRNQSDAALVMQAQLADIGVEVRPVGTNFGELVGRALDPGTRDFEAMFLGFTAEFRLDDTDLFHSDRGGEPIALAGAEIPELDRLIDELAHTLDRDVARTLWREYQQVLVREQPMMFVYSPDRVAGVRRRVRGVEMDLRGEWLNIHEWWLDPAAR